MEQKKKHFDVQLVTMIVLSLLFVGVLLFAVIISSKKSGGKENEKKETVSFPAISQSEKIDYTFVSDYSVISSYDTYEYDGIDLIFSSVSYPKLDEGCGEHYESINNDILALANDYLQIKEYQITLAKEKYEHSENSAEGYIQHEYILDCKSVTLKGRFLSVLFSFSKTVSLSEPSSESIAVLYDLTTGQRADLTSLLCLDANGAIEYVKSVISQDIAINPEMYYTNALEQLQYVIDLTDVYLTNDGAVIFFGPEVLTPSVYGVRTFLIPYDKIGY